MQRTDKIFNNKLYREHLDEIAKLESDRIFCRHDMDHFIDVAHLMVMICADEGIDIKRDVIYAAALLHDIGRRKQYTEGIRHEAASAEIAHRILIDAGFDDEECAEIMEAIRQHGNENVADGKDLKAVLYRADKMSRKCYMCKAIDKCHKAPEKRIMSIV